MRWIVLMTLWYLSGIEQSFRDKCHQVKDHIEELRQRIEKLETNQLEGQ